MSFLDPLEKLISDVEELKIGSGILTSRYFSTLRDGEMSREAFESSQQQFFYAVRFFSRAMAALAARVVDSQERSSLIHNLAEEHGLVDDDDIGDAISQGSVTRIASGFHPRLAHDQTFRVFLNRLNSQETYDQKNSSEKPAVHSFNLALWAVCAIEPTPVAFACLGAIEFAFADISAIIGQCVVDRNWISCDALIHYKLHAEIDKRHAGDFFAVVADAWSEDVAVRRQVESGVTLGLYLFKRLYDELMVEAYEHGRE
ncbi:MAG: iron-containing redox enzyme family protein [Planctomycetaceae bacterium]